MDIAILTGCAILLALNLLFAWRAFTNRLNLTHAKRCLWVMAGLLLGPIGYYAYEGLLPTELFCED